MNDVFHMQLPQYMYYETDITQCVQCDLKIRILKNLSIIRPNNTAPTCAKAIRFKLLVFTYISKTLLSLSQSLSLGKNPRPTRPLNLVSIYPLYIYFCKRFSPLYIFCSRYSPIYIFLHKLFSPLYIFATDFLLSIYIC